MADAPIGEIQIAITGDYSELETAIQSAASAATSGADVIAGAFDRPDAGKELTESIENVQNAAVTAGEQFSLFGGQVEDTSSQMSLFDTSAIGAADSMLQVGDGAGAAATSLKDAADAADKAAEAAKESESEWSELTKTMLELGGITLSIEALKDLASEAVQAFSTIQNASVALTAMSGSAEVAAEQIDGLERLANQDALSFPSLLSAGQRMTAFGMSAEQVTTVLGEAADAAAATGNSFDQVSSSLTRVIESGSAGVRQLTQLGITQQQLAAVMGVSATAVAADFKAMDPSDRIAVISQALQKFSGDAQLMTTTVTGQLNLLSNAFEKTAATVGASLGPAEAGLASLATYVVSGFGEMWSRTIGEAQTDWMNLITLLATGSTAGYASFQAGTAELQRGVAVIVAAFTQGKAAADQFFTSMAGQSAKLQDAQTTLANMSIQLDTASKLFSSGQISLAVYQTTVEAYGKALDAASTNGENFADSLVGISSAQDKANNLLGESLATLQQVTPGTADYARAIQNVASAWDAANPGGVQFTNTLMGIRQEASQQTATYNSLVQTFSHLSASFQAGSISANVFLDAAAKMASAASAAHIAFANVNVDVLNIGNSVAQAKVDSDAAAAAFDVINTKYGQGVVGLQALIKALDDAKTAATNAGTSFFNASAEAAKLNQGAQLQIQAFTDDIAVLGKYNTVLGQTPEQAVAAAAALKNLSGAGQSLGIEVTAIAGAQNSFNISTASTSPAIQGLVQHLVTLFTQAGLTATATTTGTQAIAGYTTTLSAAGVPVQTYVEGIAKIGTTAQTVTQALGPMAAAAAAAVAGVQHVGTAGASAASTGLNPFSAAAVGATTHLNEYTGAIEGGTTAGGAFSAAAVASTVHVNAYTGAIEGAAGGQGAFSAAAVGSTIHVNEYTGAIESSTGSMNTATGAADSLSGGLDKVAASAKSAASAMQGMEGNAGFGGDGQMAGSSSSAAGYLGILAAAGAPAGVLDQAAEALGLVKIGERSYETLQEWNDTVGKSLGVVMDLNGNETRLNTSTTAASNSIEGWTTNVWGASTATAAATTAITAAVQPVQDIAYSSASATTGLATTATAATNASTAVAGLAVATSSTILTQAQLDAASKALNDTIAGIDPTLQNSAAGMQTALNQTSTAVLAFGSAVGVALSYTANANVSGLMGGSGSPTNPLGLTQDQISAAWKAYTDSTNQVTTGLTNVAQGTVQMATAQGNAYAAYQKVADTLNQTLGYQASTAASMTASVGGPQTNGQGIGPSSYDAQSGLYTASQTIGNQTYTAQGTTIQAAQEALSQILLKQSYGANPFGGGGQTSGGTVAPGGPTQGVNFGVTNPMGSNSFGLPQTPAYTSGNPLPVKLTDPQVPSITINIPGATIVGQNGAMQLAQSVQQQIITTLRQAGLKI